jgi:prepilin-type N-terminal cleavage/methylation domain-containing protein
MKILHACRRDRGFTLVELMIVIAIIGILSAIAVPNFLSYRERGIIARTASDLNTIVKGFQLYAIDNPGPYDGYPDDTHRVLPTGVEAHVNNTLFISGTPLGGYYNWEGPDTYPYAGVSIESPTADEARLIQLDAVMDDGNLSSGKFQKTSNSRYTHILWLP